MIRFVEKKKEEELAPEATYDKNRMLEKNELFTMTYYFVSTLSVILL